MALFLGYLVLIGRMKDIRRVFEYHGAEHKTIAAYEHGDPLEPAAVDRYSTLHVRCGTNFLLIVMLLAVLIYSFFSVQGLLFGILLRVVTIPVIAGISYELLRLGAKYSNSLRHAGPHGPRALAPEDHHQAPDRSQIEVAIASFEEVLRREGRVPSSLGLTAPTVSNAPRRCLRRD